MQAIRLKYIAKKESITLRAAHERYRDSLLYMRGHGRGGRTAILPVTFLENLDYWQRYIEYVDDEKIINDVGLLKEKNLKLSENENGVLRKGRNKGRNKDFKGNFIFLNDDKSIVLSGDKNNEKVYYSAEKVGTILSFKTERGIRVRASREMWDYIDVPMNGGLKKYYSEKDLPMQARVTLAREMQRIRGVEEDAKEAGLGLYGSASEGHQKKADRRLHILQEWRQVRDKAGKKHKRKADEKFVKSWNEDHPQEKISRATLHRWQKEFNQAGLDGVTDKYSRAPRYVAPFHEDAKAYFLSLYLHENRRDVYHCYQNTLAEAEIKGWQVPSFSTCWRVINGLDPHYVRMCRHGVDSFKNDAIPSMLRDPESVEVGEIYISDERVIDVSFGKGCVGERLWVTAWMDMRSRKFVSVTYGVSGNRTEAVLDSFYEAAMLHTPKGILIDNGSNYREAGYTGKNERESLPENLRAPFEMLLRKENVHFALAGNARTKTIERAFKTMSKIHDKAYSKGYTGMHIFDRPDGWYVTKTKGDFKSAKEIVDLCNHYFFDIYNNFGPRGKKSPNEIWAEHFETHSYKRAPAENLRALLLRTHPKPLKRTRFGVRFGKWPNGKGVFYWDEWVSHLPMTHKKFLIRFTETDHKKIWLYQLDGRPLGEVPLYFGQNVHALKDREKVAKFQEMTKRSIKEAKAHKAKLDAQHGVNFDDPEQLMKRADIRPEPKPKVDMETGEVIENVEMIELDFEVPPTVEQKRAEMKRKKKLQSDTEAELESLLKKKRNGKLVDNDDDPDAWAKMERRIGGKK